MKRLAIALQIALAVLLTGLWLGWNPFSSDCRSDRSNCGEDDVFTEPVPVTRSVEPSVETHFEVEYGGCAMIVASTDDEVECIYEPGAELRVWVVHPRVDEVRLEIDGQPWVTTEYVVQEEPGQGFRGELVGERAQRLIVRSPDEKSWELWLRASTRLTTEEQAARERRPHEGKRLEERMMNGELDAMSDVRRLVEELIDQGLLSEAVDEVLAVSFYLNWHARRPDLAQELLKKVRPAAERYPEGGASLAIYRGHGLRLQGRLVEAARAYRRGGRHGVRMDDAALQLDALSSYAKVLAELGYFEAAAYWGARALAHAREQDTLDAVVDIMVMVAATNLELRRAGQAHDDPEPLFHEVMRISSRIDAPLELAEARLGLAERALFEEDPAEALLHLGRVDDSALTSDLLVELSASRLQALLANGATEREVRGALSRLEDLASQGAERSLRWIAMIHRGEVLEREGDLEGAQEVYERGEALLDRLIPLALLGVQGELAPARRQHGTKRLVSVLLQQDRSEQAFCTLRQAKTRMGQLARLFPRLDAETRASLRSRVTAYRRAKGEYEALLLSAGELPVKDRERARREAARLHEELDHHALEILATQAGYQGRPSCDELSPRRPDELLIGLYTYGDGLLVLVQDDTGTTHRVLSDHESLTRPDNARWLGNVLLDPLDAQLASAARVRVLASGEAAAIDVHALPWRERPLLEQVPVVYGLDLPPRERQGVAAGSPSALVLADAMAKGTEREAKDVAAMLSEGGWAVQRMGSAQRSASQLRKDLSLVEHFHYAGHAYYDADHQRQRVGQRASDDGDEAVLRLWPPYPGGAAAEPSYLPLGSAGRLDVQDILMMEQVPRSVVLMGCATGVHDERVAYGGFSLATAFLGAGAEAVVASTREVDGEEASLVGRGLYTELGGRGVGEPGAWLMHGVRWAREHGLPERATRDYRVFVP